MKRILLFFVVAVLFSFGISSAQESTLSEAEQKEQQIIDRFWLLFEKAPRRGTSLDRVYGYYVDTGRSDDLLKRCKELTEKTPDSGKSWLLLGLVLSRRSDDDATVAAFKKAMELDQNEVLAPFYLGESYIAQGQLQNAAETLEIALKRSLDNPKKEGAATKDVLAVLQTLGRVYERFGDSEKSAKVWNKLEELFPGDRDILVRIAETLEEESKFDEAFKRYQKLAELAKDDQFARVQYTLAAADIKIRLGNKQGAIDDFEKLLEELSGESWLAQSIRDRVERIFVRQADYAGLAGYYQKRLKNHPNDLDTVRRLAMALVRLSRTEEAQKLLAETLEKAPANIPLRLALIDLLVNSKDFDAVDKNYAKINELEPNNPDYISQWGLAALENAKLTETERKAAAVKIWSQLITAKPGDPATIIMVADLTNTAKIPVEAEKLYKKAVEIRPNDPGYKEYLGYFYHHEGRKDEAIATLRQIADGDRRNAGTLAQLGGILKSLGYIPEAITALKEAVEIDPKDFNLRMQYADILYNNEHAGEAEKEYSVAGKLATPLSDEYARYLHAYTKLLLSEQKQDQEAETSLAAKEGTSDAQTFWRQAVYQAASGKQAAATEFIEKAIALKPDSNILLAEAADIFVQGDDTQRAAVIYEKLANADPQRRVDHLKKLAQLQRELGEMDKALETARLVMATGAGNAANSRFYAEMLLNIGRQKDGIEALRRAVRLDPTDTVSLSALADVLFDTGNIDEALEILWRVFDRTEDIAGKIGAVSKMSTYYQQSQRFDQLIERLRQNAKDAASRRESAYCLAQAYVTVSDYDAARQALESLLLGSEDKEKKSDDTMLLSQLSKISELQGDISTAIRYQEMLCDQLQSGKQVSQENERLLGLYQLSGEKDKAVDQIIRTLIEKGELREQIQAVDTMLAQEDYVNAQKILKRLEMKQPNQWEFLYRRLMLEYWLKDLDAAQKTAAEILALEVVRTELSAKKRYEDEQLKKPGTNTAQVRSRMTPYQGYSAWQFGNNNNGSVYYSGELGGNTQQIWRVANAQIVQTLFREKLSLERYYYQRGMSVTTEPPKPQFEPQNFGDARFAAQLWQLKIAFQRDIDKIPPAAKQEKETDVPVVTNSPSESPASIAVSPESSEKKINLDGFTKALSDLRRTLPPDSPDVQSLTNRLRLEYFLQQFYQTIQQSQSTFTEGDYGKLLFTLEESKETPKESEPQGISVTQTITQTVVPSQGTSAPAQAVISVSQSTASDSVVNSDVTIAELRSKIEYQLAMKGEKDWFPSVYTKMTVDLNRQIYGEQLKKYDIEKEFDNAVKNATPEFREKFNDEQIAESKKFLLEKIPVAIQKEKEETGKNDSVTFEQKLDMIFRTWEMAIETPPQNNYYMVFSSYGVLHKTLEKLGRNEDVKKLEELVARGEGNNPVMIASMAQSSMINGVMESDEASFFPVAVFSMLQFIYQSQRLALSGNNEEENKILTQTLQLLSLLQRSQAFQQPQSFDKQFVSLKAGIQRLKEADVKIKQLIARQPVTPPSQAFPNVVFNQFNFDLPQHIENYFQNYFQRFALLPLSSFGSVSYTYQMMQTGGSYVQLMVPTVNLSSSDEARKKKITQHQLDQFTANEKECYRLLDYYFELMNEIETETKPVQTPVQSPKRLSLPALTSYKSYLEQGQSLQSYEINNILRGEQSQNIAVRYPVNTNREVVLANMYGYEKFLDEILKTFEPEEGIDPEKRKPDHVERFEKYLDAKAKNGTEIDKKHVENVKLILDQKSARITSALTNVNQEYDALEYLRKFEAEENERKAKGEKPEPQKLFVMALLYKQKGEMLKAVQRLDAISFTGAGDIRYREQLVLKWFPPMSNDAGMKKRAEIAVKRLGGYQLNGAELLDLRQTLLLLERNEEADKIRDRILVTVNDLTTQYNLLQELQRNARDEKSKQQLVQFALRIFRSPAVRNAMNSRDGDISRHVRDQVLNILKNNGKLSEIVEQIEAQWKSSPGSIDLMSALADIYNKAGRKDDAKKLVQTMNDKIPDDTAKMLTHANLLRNLGMTEESAEWTQKALAKNPERMLQNFWQYEQSFQQTKQIPKLIELLRKIKPQVLAQQFGEIGYRVSEWLKDKGTASAAKELIDYIWKMEGVSDSERRTLRSGLVRNLSTQNVSEEFYPMFHEVIINSITPEKSSSNTNTSNSRENLFSVYSWSDTSCNSAAGTFFDIAAKKKNLEETKKEFQEIVNQFANDQSSNSAEQRRLAQLFLAVNEMRLKNADAAVAIMESLEKNTRPNAQNESENIILGLELAALDHPKTMVLAISMFETELKNNNSSYDRIILPPLCKLYIKTDKADTGKELALDKLREAFKYLKFCGNNYQYQIGNRYYDIYSLQQSAVTFSKLLIENGAAFDVMIIFREMYDGQSWIGLQRQQYNFRLNELDKISGELAGKMTAEDFLKHLEQLIPEPAKPTEETEEAAKAVPPLPLILGHYYMLVPATGSEFSEIDLFTLLMAVIKNNEPKKSFTGVRLFEAIQTVVEKEPDRYAEIKKRLEALEKLAPEDMTVLMTLTFCRLLDKDQTAAVTLIHRLAEEVKKVEGAFKKDTLIPVYFGLWSLLKSVITGGEEILNNPEVKSDCERIFRYTGNVIGQFAAPSSTSSSNVGNSQIRSFLVDVRQYAPAEWLVQFKPEFNTAIVENLLLTGNGQLLETLNTKRRRIAEQLSEIAGLQGIKPVMEVFEKTFKNGFPKSAGGVVLNRENSFFLLEIAESVLRTAEKIKADPKIETKIDPNILFESLLKIVLPPENARSPFLARYPDLGGENGYFRTLAADLVNWAVAANRVDDLKNRIAEKRDQNIENIAVPLDAIELLLAAKTGDKERVTKLASSFLNIIRDEDQKKAADAVSLLMTAVVPAVKPYKDSEVNDKFNELSLLIDAAVSSPLSPRRYTYYTIRSLYDRFAQYAELSHKIHWLERYREVTDRNIMDGFRFTKEDDLYKEGLKFLETGHLANAAAILKFFASCQTDDFHYKDLTDYLTAFETKLKEIPETERQIIFGDLDLTKIVKQGNVQREEGNKTGLIAQNYDLPPLPEGKVVYQNDFETETGTAWSIDRREMPPKRTGTYLGEFYNENLHFHLADLPEHQFVRLRFDLLILGGIDGLLGYPSFGVDIWGMKLDNGTKPIVTTFSNYHKDPNNQKQSFPDDYGPELDFIPAWYGAVQNSDLWDDELQKGYYFGRHGAVIENKLGYQKDTIYAIDIIVPHQTPEFSLDFYTKFLDDPYDNGAINKSTGESWGLDNIKVELLEKPLELDAAAMKSCFEALIGDDGMKSAAARWRLVAAGNATVDFIAKWFEAEENTPRRKEIQSPNNFDQFRINRVLQLINTPEAETLRKLVMNH